MGPTRAVCRAHVCEAAWIGPDGGPDFVMADRRCLPAVVNGGWSGCVLVSGSAQNGYYVRNHAAKRDAFAPGEPAMLARVCPFGMACVDAAVLAGSTSPPPSMGAPGYACRAREGGHDAPEGRCVESAK